MRRAGGALFWARWSLRDLRRRWPLVLAIALLIAVGTGLATGLGSMEGWRVRSADASYALLRAHDLRATLAEGSYVPTGTLVRAARTSAAAPRLTAAEERLVVSTQLDASSEGRVVLTPARLIGVPDARPPAAVDALWIARGRGLAPGTDGVVVEAKYADRHDLALPGVVRVAGGRRLRVVGHGTSPDTFLVIPPAGLFGGEATFAVVWAPLELAQEIGRVGNRVNELVLTVQPGTDLSDVERDLQAAFRGALGNVGVALTTMEGEDVHRVLYEDASNDQEFMTVFAALVLLGAAFGAFNLITRIVEAQRREIGICMALGVPSTKLAVRPLLLAAEVSLLGVVLGVAVGLATGWALQGILADLLPLPATETPFEPGVFARGAAIGFIVPFVGALYPVVRGVRMTPVQAIEVGLRSAHSSRLLSVVGRVPLPGRSVARLPFRNVARTPRRTLLTSLALAAVTGVLVTMLAIFDSFDAAIDTGRRETVQGTPDRVTVQLSSVVPVGSDLVRSVSRQRSVGRVSTTLQLPGSVRAGGRAIDVSLVLLDPETSIWRPTVLPGGAFRAGGEGIVLSRKAAKDLGVTVGETITLRHPLRTGPRTFGYALREVPVAGLHPSPFRVPAYMDSGTASRFGLTNATNALDVLPAPGRSTDDVMQSLFPIDGVTSVERASTVIDTLRDSIDEYTSILRVTELGAFALVLLLAFNATGIASEERVREHATMLAFGVPVRSIVGSAAIENALVGLLGTLGGLGLGWVVVRWMTGSLLPEVIPDAEVRPMISAASVAVTLAVGVGAMAVAPLVMLRRLVRLDLPSALRVVE